MIFKAKSQDFKLLKKTHPDLYTLVNSMLPDSSDSEKGKVAGLCIEYVIQSGGDVDVFQEDIEVTEKDFEEESDFETEQFIGF